MQDKLDLTGLPDLSPQRWRAVLLWSEGRTNADVARELGVAAHTVSAWYQRQDVQAVLLAFRARMAAGVQETIAGLLLRRLAVIDAIFEDDRVPAETKIELWFRLLAVAAPAKNTGAVRVVESRTVDVEGAADPQAVFLALEDRVRRQLEGS